MITGGILFVSLILICGILMIGLSDNFITNKIKTNFYKKLETLCREELIIVKVYKDLEELNKSVYPDEYEKMEIGKWADGVYTFNILQIRPPTISLHKKSSVWTFAHEIGHHFSIKKDMNRSEKAADRYIRVLAKKYIPFWQLIFIWPTVLVYSN